MKTYSEIKMTDDIDIAQPDGCNCVEGEEEAVDEGPETVLLSSEKGRDLTKWDPFQRC